MHRVFIITNIFFPLDFFHINFFMIHFYTANSQFSYPLSSLFPEGEGYLHINLFLIIILSRLIVMIYTE